jgi:hypothetical protein
MWTLTFGESVTTKVQYSILHVRHMYIFLHRVGVNGRGHSDSKCGLLDIMDGPTLEKSHVRPF